MLHHFTASLRLQWGIIDFNRPISYAWVQRTPRTRGVLIPSAHSTTRGALLAGELLCEEKNTQLAEHIFILDKNARSDALLAQNTQEEIANISITPCIKKARAGAREYKRAQTANFYIMQYSYLMCTSKRNCYERTCHRYLPVNNYSTPY